MNNIKLLPRNNIFQKLQSFKEGGQILFMKEGTFKGTETANKLIDKETKRLTTKSASWQQKVNKLREKAKQKVDNTLQAVRSEESAIQHGRQQAQDKVEKQVATRNKKIQNWEQNNKFTPGTSEYAKSVRTRNKWVQQNRNPYAQVDKQTLAQRAATRKFMKRAAGVTAIGVPTLYGIYHANLSGSSDNTQSPYAYNDKGQLMQLDPNSGQYNAYTPDNSFDGLIQHSDGTVTDANGNIVSGTPIDSNIFANNAAAYGFNDADEYGHSQGVANMQQAMVDAGLLNPEDVDGLLGQKTAKAYEIFRYQMGGQRQGINFSLNKNNLPTINNSSTPQATQSDITPYLSNNGEYDINDLYNQGQ